MMGLYLALVLMTLVTSNMVLGEMGDILKLLNNLRENEERRQMVSQLTENELVSRSMSSSLDAFLLNNCTIGGETCKFHYECCKGSACIDSRAERRPPCTNGLAERCCKGSS